jgi:hypothetical protein
MPQGARRMAHAACVAAIPPSCRSARAKAKGKAKAKARAKHIQRTSSVFPPMPNHCATQKHPGSRRPLIPRSQIRRGGQFTARERGANARARARESLPGVGGDTCTGRTAWEGLFPAGRIEEGGFLPAIPQAPKAEAQEKGLAGGTRLDLNEGPTRGRARHVEAAQGERRREGKAWDGRAAWETMREDRQSGGKGQAVSYLGRSGREMTRGSCEAKGHAFGKGRQEAKGRKAERVKGCKGSKGYHWPMPLWIWQRLGGDNRKP